MRLSPVQAHQMRVNAAQSGAHAALDEQQRALRWLHTQRALLAGIQSRQAREEHKAQVLPEITPYLRGVLVADSGARDIVVTYCAIWAIDAGAWDLALELGGYATRHQLPMPDEFARNAPTLLADLMSDAAFNARLPAAQVPALLTKVLAMTENANMPDQTRAKAHKAIAWGLAGKTMLASQSGDFSTLDEPSLRMALHHLTQAERLDPRCGVKKDILTVRRLLGGKDAEHAQIEDKDTDTENGPDQQAVDAPAPRTRAARKTGKKTST